MHDELKPVLDSYYDYWFGVSAFYETWAKKRGLTANSLFTLYVIHANSSSCTQRLICEKLQLPKQTVNAILDIFEKKGYVLKEVLEEDRRNKRLLLTSSGQVYTDGLLAELHSLEERALLNMQASDRAALIKSSHSFLNELSSSAKLQNE